MCVTSLNSTASAYRKGDFPITQNEQWLCIKATYPVEVGRWAALLPICTSFRRKPTGDPVNTFAGTETAPHLVSHGVVARDQTAQSLSVLNSVS